MRSPTLATLFSRYERLRQENFPSQIRVFAVEAGADLSAEQKATIQPGDQVIIEEYPLYYFTGPPTEAQA